jgi:hypothetical protein
MLWSTFLLPFTVGMLPFALVVFAFWAFGTWFGLPGQQTIVASLNASAAMPPSTAAP